jgi:hypothetical protein
MNLGVQAIHRVLTREIPINDKKAKSGIRHKKKKSKKNRKREYSRSL